MDGLAQENTALASSKMSVMVQLAQLTAAMGYMQEQMKKIITKQKRNF